MIFVFFENVGLSDTIPRQCMGRDTDSNPRLVPPDSVCKSKLRNLIGVWIGTPNRTPGLYHLTQFVKVN